MSTTFFRRQEPAPAGIGRSGFTSSGVLRSRANQATPPLRNASRWPCLHLHYAGEAIQHRRGVSRFARKDGSIYCERTMLEPLETVVFDDTQGLHDVTSVTSGRTDMGIRDICGFSFNPM